MKITVQSSKAVKPAHGSGGAPCPTATDNVVPLTVFDKVNFDQRISGVNFFHPPAPPHGALELGLAKALAAHRVWAGRLGVDANGDRAIVLNDAGARFVEATADVALASLLPLEPTPELLGLHPGRGGRGAEELMLVQVTRFACGSFAVGTTAHHLVADGHGVGSFVVAWGNATRGAAIDPVVPPRDRASIFAPRCPPRVEFEHRGAEFKPGGDQQLGTRNVDPGDDEPVVHRVRFDREFLAELRSTASAGAALRPSFSTLQCVAAHLWRCVTKARGLGGGEVTTTLRIAVDGRRRMHRQRVPEGYTGNVVLWARPATTAGELVSMPLRHAAALVSRAVASVDDRYFRSFIDFASSGAVEAEGLAPAAGPAKNKVHSPDVEVYSLVGLPFPDLDFGTGRPFLHTVSYLPEEGLVFLESSPSGDGGIDALVCLFRRAMNVFKTCCYTLPTGADARL
ncbi:Agmatine coumaroyltransferase-2 [Dichanthelium oligosanthes]|uniref:Agmatine coumaroyltransferase-2 n=1 Tax=Dichanthelium oligosanthes TaxID=888268 RepID=A0A1E5VPC7_9POAL|nr:Agmatine coumaroyltransferase-2 [Dichanthelium oligosanthes]